MKPEETVDFHIRWAWHRIARMYNVEAAKHGFSMSVGYVLLNIDKEGTPSTKLGPKMGMEARSLTRTLRTMEEDGLVKRVPDKTDKRMVRVFLTDKGKEKREISRDKVIQFNLAVQNHIPKSKLKVYFEVLERMNEFLEDNNIFEEDLASKKN